MAFVRRARWVLVAALTLLVGLVVYRHAGADRGERTTAPTTAGLRRASERAVESPRMPAARVEIADGAFRHAGAHKFVLHGVADAEQHVFVDADAAGRVRRLYWVQFEGYLPSAPLARYDYSKSEAVAEISGFAFHADGGVRSSATPPKKGSDGALVRQLLASRGLPLPSDVLVQRLVWVDPGRRDELMFIYLEDLAPLGLTAADLAEGGKAAARLPQLKRELLARAAAGVRLVR